MSWLEYFANSTSKIRVVVVVTSENISWYRYENLRITDRLKHSIDEEPQSIICSCPWLKNLFENTKATIELIVDTELDDLDRVKLIDSTHWLSRAWHIRKVLWQLQREYPDATVNKLPDFLYPEIASVLYSQFSDKQLAWIEQLNDCDIVVSHLVTSKQLLSDLFLKYPSPVMLHLFDGRDRHKLLLVVNGVAVHMRQAVDVDNSGSVFAEEYLGESLKYLSESVFSSLKQVLLVFPRVMNSAQQSEFPDEYLAEHLLGLQCDFQYQKISLCNADVQAASALVNLGSLNAGRLSDIYTSEASAYSLKKPKLVSTVSTKKTYALIRQSEKFRNVLARSITTINRRRHRINLRRCTLLFLLIFVFIGLASFRSSAHSLKQQARFKDEHASVKANLHKFKQEAAALHESPSYVMESISRINLFEETAIATPLQIMTSIAGAVKEFPSVSVAGLVWSIVDDKSDTYMAIDSVSIRDRYWGEDSSQASTMVELSGQVVGQGSLRSMQIQLDSFIDVLSQSENISVLRVVDSPAKAAGSSQGMAESGSFFRLHFSIKPI